MKLFEWDGSLNVGITQVDNQHERLFALVNAYFAVMRNAEAGTIIADTITELFDYATEHFALEEKMLQDHGYPQLAEHRAEHAYYLGKIASYQVMLREGIGSVEGRAITVELWKFMKGWLVEHIMTRDMEYRNHFRSNGILERLDES